MHCGITTKQEMELLSCELTSCYLWQSFTDLQWSRTWLTKNQKSKNQKIKNQKIKKLKTHNIHNHFSHKKICIKDKQTNETTHRSPADLKISEFDPMGASALSNNVWNSKIVPSTWGRGGGGGLNVPFLTDASRTFQVARLPPLTTNMLM